MFEIGSLKYHTRLSKRLYLFWYVLKFNPRNLVYRRIYIKALPFVIQHSQHISHCLHKTQSTSLLSVCEKKFISAMLGINGAKPCPMVLYHIVWIFTCYILWYQISWEYDAQRGDVTYKMVHRCKVISNLNQNDLIA